MVIYVSEFSTLLVKISLLKMGHIGPTPEVLDQSMLFKNIACFLDKGLSWWLRWWRVCLQCGRPGSDPWVGKIPLEKEMATHSSILAWKIPWTQKPGMLQSMGSERIRHDWVTNILSLIDSLSCVTRVQLAKIDQCWCDCFIISLPDQNSFYSGLWIISHSPFLG